MHVHLRTADETKGIYLEVPLPCRNSSILTLKGSLWLIPAGRSESRISPLDTSSETRAMIDKNVGFHHSPPLFMSERNTRNGAPTILLMQSILHLLDLLLGSDDHLIYIIHRGRGEVNYRGDTRREEKRKMLTKHWLSKETLSLEYLRCIQGQ